MSERDQRPRSTTPNAVGSSPVPNPTLKASVPEDLYNRVLKESERVGVDPPMYVRQVLIMALDGPRRLEDCVTIMGRLDAR